MIAFPDVTLFTGGLFPRLLRRFGIAPLRARNMSLVLLPVVAWLPLPILTAIGGRLLPGNLPSPFLQDISVHARLLVALPLLIVAGIVAEQRLRPTVEQFVARRLVPGEMLPRFNAAIETAFRWGDSIVPDIVAIVVVYGVVTPVVWHAKVAQGSSSWFAESATLSAAGMWFVFVSLPLFEFILLRWYYRLFIWARFLFGVSRLKLHLLPAHPDRVGGLGFLLIGTQGLAAFAFAHGALLAGWVANQVLFGGATLPEFKGEAVAVIVLVLLVTVLPLFAFVPNMLVTKRRGELQYGALASHYVDAFDRKWLRDDAGDEGLIGSADIQSMADMGATYELADRMRSIPVTMQLLVVFVVSTMAPALPLMLTVMPLKDILKKLAGVLV
ncbi:MAG: hypothetical protein JO199_08580 [Candidatus Eremiobacteraeota bacterium]|nr:hypothetical protein [Candidatus Eremiobacteraeota bacterium]